MIKVTLTNLIERHIDANRVLCNDGLVIFEKEILTSRGGYDTSEFVEAIPLEHIHGVVMVKV